MNPRERPGVRGLVFPPSWSGERYTAAEELAHERLQEAEGERAPADVVHRLVGVHVYVHLECGQCREEWQQLGTDPLKPGWNVCPHCNLAGPVEESEDA